MLHKTGTILTAGILIDMSGTKISKRRKIIARQANIQTRPSTIA